MTDHAGPLSAAEALEAVLARHPGAATRPGQRAMLQAVEEAIVRRHHLLVQAGTGTGKSLAYLVPAVLASARPAEPEDGDDAPHRRAVVATATKALQEQLVGKDLPMLHAALARRGLPFRYAMLKGRANYLCLAKTAAAVGGQQELEDADIRGDVEALARWAKVTPTGDRADLPAAVAQHVWSEVSADAVECPGANSCAFGSVCFAEAARRRAASADVVVVNSHLYALDLESGGAVLPAHDLVVLDEAHAMEDIATAVFGVTLSAGRLRHLAGRLRRLLAEPDLPERLDGRAADLQAALEPHDGQRLLSGTGELSVVLGALRDLTGEVAAALDALQPTDEEAVTRHQLCTRLTAALGADLEVALALTDASADQVAWAERARDESALRIAPVDVGPLLAGRLPDGVILIATSATLSVAGDFSATAWRLGLRDPAAWTGVQVDSPFDYPRQGLLYCAVHLPDPRQRGFSAAMHHELEALVAAAGGRTLALFTSRSAMTQAATALRAALPSMTILVQDELPRAQLLRRLRTDPRVAVCATLSFWQGVDLPGSAVLLVTIDKLPFPRPTDPLVQARRQAVAADGGDPFATVDLVRAATLLAQGVGRLIRTATDRGVVAVFDRRLSLAPYAWTLVDSLPPMRRTRERNEATALLRQAAAEATATVSQANAQSRPAGG
ncbi:MAG TPA: ATP-dependent DNA helicase [Egibacteraceae bacterium]|nr:ATP-dependent DNA helicase [Egibacteraceae bacterium]